MSGMSRRTTRPVSKRPHRRRPARPQPKTRFSPFIWIVIGVVLVLLALLSTLGWWVVEGRITPTPTPTPSLTPTLSPTPSITPVVPTATLIPMPTEAPQTCMTRVSTQAHSEPRQVTIKEPLPRGKIIIVVGELVNEDVHWYRVDFYGVERYIPVEDVNCGGEP